MRSEIYVTQTFFQGYKSMNAYKYLALALGMFVIALGFSGKVDAQEKPTTLAIMNGQVHTIAGSVIDEGDVIIEGGRIVAVGVNLAAPSGSQVIDATGKIVTPGIIAPFSTLGLTEVSAVSETNDTRTDEKFSLGAALDAADAYNPASSLIAVNRAGGVTRAVSVPEANGFLFGGAAIMIDLSGQKNSVTKHNIARSLQLGVRGANRAGGSRIGAWGIVREMLDAAIAYANDPVGYNKDQSEGRYTIADLKSLGGVLRAKQSLLVRVNRASDIRAVIKLKNDYRLKLVIVGGSEAWREAKALAAANIPVILDPFFNLPAEFEDLSASLKNAAFLDEAGVLIAFYNPPSGSHNLRLLTQQAGNAVANGLSFQAALAALTLNPATIYGLGSELGSIEVGKIADIVVWDADPLELSSDPEVVIINGDIQSLQNRQNLLLQRYKDLQRGDLPFAYRGGE